ncbi:hypothetical protein [Candidatus Contubernalis alkaliaceticus]|uniref:hypothetical protein n=1 Tax=Candidatus Contubernalis alkaliaceticus TaxID=338645 RepID=UPI001F4C4918|nr:hypothetical protein [Candidatus Contubernalis alkalaceticus]UNC91927.1 hypothetical protein HUE98_07350 [Candidatus Contubernalis alkalaceticus]
MDSHKDTIKFLGTGGARFVLKNKPWKLAEQLSLETGVQVIAAHDGMTLNIHDYLKTR